MNQVKVLRQEEFIFRIIIPNESEYYGLQGMMNLSKNLPTTAQTIFVKEASPLCKIYCITSNHSDYLGIEEKFDLKTEVI